MNKPLTIRQINPEKSSVYLSDDNFSKFSKSTVRQPVSKAFQSSANTPRISLSFSIYLNNYAVGLIVTSVVMTQLRNPYCQAWSKLSFVRMEPSLFISTSFWNFNIKQKEKKQVYSRKGLRSYFFLNRRNAFDFQVISECSF